MKLPNSLESSSVLELIPCIWLHWGMQMANSGLCWFPLGLAVGAGFGVIADPSVWVDVPGAAVGVLTLLSLTRCRGHQLLERSHRHLHGHGKALLLAVPRLLSRQCHTHPVLAVPRLPFPALPHLLSRQQHAPRPGSATFAVPAVPRLPSRQCCAPHPGSAALTVPAVPCSPSWQCHVCRPGSATLTVPALPRSPSWQCHAPHPGSAVLAVPALPCSSRPSRPQGRFTIAAKHHITIAEIYEAELVDIEKVRVASLVMSLEGPGTAFPENLG